MIFSAINLLIESQANTPKQGALAQKVHSFARILPSRAHENEK